ncbi:glycosyltransferase [bacterium]|nr:glycosyltransferase [bacterium]
MTDFSIIMASYNYEKYIEEAINSVINQTFKNWELIIVDDGSSDNSIEKIKKYCDIDERIKFYTHPNNVNKGLGETIKLGFEKANGEWIAFLESDDVLKPETLERRNSIIKSYPQVNFIFNDIELFGNDYYIRVFENNFNKIRKILDNTNFPCNVMKFLEKKNIVPTFSCVSIKKDELSKCDFNSPVDALLDYFLWVQIARENKFYYLNEKLTFWRIHSKSYINSYTKDKKQKFEMKIKLNNMFANHYKYNFLKYIICKIIVIKNVIKKRFTK